MMKLDLQTAVIYGLAFFGVVYLAQRFLPPQGTGTGLTSRMVRQQGTAPVTTTVSTEGLVSQARPADAIE